VDEEKEEVVIEEVEYRKETTRTGVDPLKQAMQNDPNAIKNAAKMLENMDPATLEQMMKNMPGAPAGMSVDPSMMKMAAKMMENMSPEDIQRMQDMSRAFASTGGASSTSSAAGNPMQNFSPSSMEDMKKMTQNPAMLKQMQQMLKGMDPEALCSMMKASGVNVTPDQAKKMVDQLGNLNDKQIERIAKVAHIIGAVVSAYQKTKEYAKKNPLMVLAVIALLIALFLRWKGIM
jgi:ribosomal protein L12E/L44/L45/RPP1/RPP2